MLVIPSTRKSGKALYPLFCDRLTEDEIAGIQNNTACQRRKALRDLESSMHHVAVVNVVDPMQKTPTRRHRTSSLCSGAGKLYKTSKSGNVKTRTTQYPRCCSRYRRSSSTRRAFFSLSSRILWASVPSSMRDSLNHGCCRASFAVIRFFGS